MPDFNIADFKQTGRIEIFLNVDSTYSIFPAVQGLQPISIGEPFIGVNTISNWISNNFTVEANNGTVQVLLSGSLSNDGKMVNSLAVSVIDSTSGTVYLSYGFTATGMKVISASSEFIIYKINGDYMKNNMQNLFLKGGPIGSERAIGNTDDWGNFIDKRISPIPPQCILIFSKQ
jgi:hypothetical protein